MVYLFSALTIILLLLSWKYILRLEPAGVFAALWLSMAFFTLLLQNYIDLNFEGCSFLMLGVVCFVIGTISSDYFYNPTPSGSRLELKKKWVRPLLLVLPEGSVTLDGREYPVELSDGFGAFATLMGYLPVEGFSGGRPEHIALRLALADPAEWGDPLIDGTETDLSF